MGNVIGYARRSRERENGALSLDDQEQRIRRWAEYKELALTEVVREDAVPGALPPAERPRLGPAIRTLKEGDVLVVAKLDRLSRSVWDFLGLIRDARERGWLLVCLDPEFDLTTAAGRMTANMFAAFAEFEKDQLVERLQGARRAKAARGGYAGGSRLHRRYGYRLVELPDGRRDYEPVSEEQEAIARMRKLRDDGMTLQQVRDRLEDDGIPSPTGSGWNRPTVHRILKREVRR